MPEFTCTNCWQSHEYPMDAAKMRLEKTTVYQKEGESEAFVCERCGALLEPFIDEI